MGPTAKVVDKKLASMIAKNTTNDTAKHSTGSAADSFSHYSAQPLCAYVGLALQLIALSTHSYMKLPSIVSSATAEWPPDSDIIIFFIFLFAADPTMFNFLSGLL